MSNEQNAVRERHLESLASAVADKFASFGGGGTSDVMTGATASTSGTSGLVPAPSAGAQDRFLRGDGSWARVSNSSGGTDYVIGSDVSTVEGGLWRDSINDVPVLKLRHGDYEYNFNYDSMTYLGGESSPIATVPPDTYVLGTDSVSSEGGLWYEVTNDVPTLNLHAGNFKYGFKFDSITYAGGNSRLVSYLPFDVSATADACGNEWTAVGDPTIEDGRLYLNGSSYVYTENFPLGGDDFTVDFYFQFISGGENAAPVGITGFAQVLFLGVNGGHLRGGYTSNFDVVEAQILQGTRYHGAIVYQHEAGQLLWFLNGKKCHSRSATIENANVRVGLASGVYAGNFVGYIDHFRIFDGVALWTSDFTPPTAADYR